MNNLTAAYTTFFIINWTYHLCIPNYFLPQKLKIILIPDTKAKMEVSYILNLKIIRLTFKKKSYDNELFY